MGIERVIVRFATLWNRSYSQWIMLYRNWDTKIFSWLVWAGVVGPRRLPLRSIHESKQAFRLLEVYLVQWGNPQARFQVKMDRWWWWGLRAELYASRCEDCGWWQHAGRSTIAAWSAAYCRSRVGSYQIQIFHEYNSCCFSPHGRHDESWVTKETFVRSWRLWFGTVSLSVFWLSRCHCKKSSTGGQHGYFTVIANDHIRHEVCAQDKTITWAGSFYSRGKPGDLAWDNAHNFYHHVVVLAATSNLMHESGWSVQSWLLMIFFLFFLLLQ